MYTVQYCTLTIYRYETRDERYCYVLLHFMLFITVCNNAVSIFHHLSFVFILVWKINKKSIQFCQRHFYANSCWVIFKVKSCTPTSLRISRARQSSNFVEIALITRSVVELRGGADLARAARVWSTVYTHYIGDRSLDTVYSSCGQVGVQLTKHTRAC